MASDALSKIKQIHQEARAFLEERDIGHADAGQQPPGRRFAHFWLFVAKSFIRNRCPVRASALAYSTLLALIPMLAVVLSVTTSVLKQQGEEPIRKFVEKLVEQVTPYVNPGGTADEATEESLAKAKAEQERAVQQINQFITRVQSATLGLTGMVALVFVAIMMLARIEGAFNDIWGVARGRSWYSRIILYWAAITLGPVLLIVALGLTSGSHFDASKRFLLAMPFIGKLLFGFLPVLILSLLFSLLYLLMPNTRVQWHAAVVGGLVAGTLWHLNNYLSVHFVSRITSNNAIYGSLGMVPVFMVGLYFAWIILLFGAEVAYAFQNRKTYLQSKRVENVHQRGREFVALRIMSYLARCHEQGENPPGVSGIAEKIGVPGQLVGRILQVLLQAKLVVETVDTESGYVPSRPLSHITTHDVLMAMRAGKGHEPAIRHEPEEARVRRELERVSEAERRIAAAVTLQDLISEPAERGAASAG